ncbi:MAG: choice-of-anchor D domain-containing protein [Caldilineaceae bacterium]
MVAQASLICVNKTTVNGLGNNYVSGVYASGSTVYAATQGGLSISTDGGTSFTNKTTVNGLVSLTVNGVYASGSTVYAATEGGLSICAPPAPEIDVQGKGVSIVSGDTTPSTTDDTDFGAAQMGGSTVVHTFTIRNIGAGPLTLTGANPVSVSGANAGDFTITQPSNTSIAAGSSTPFQLTFAPSAVGVRTATVTLANNDSDEGSYTFGVQGTGAQALQPTSQLTQQGSYSYPQPCTGSYPSRNCTLAFTLKNTSSGPLQIRYEQITAIGSSGNTVTVLNGTPSPGGVNTVVNDVQNLVNNATFQPTFNLVLSSNVAYTLRFKVYGYAGSSVAAAGADQAQAVELGEYAATITPAAVGGVNVFLPAIQR